MTVGPVALDEIACSAVETLIALIDHQRTCKQCCVDESFCDTARTYQSHFMRDVQRYRRAKGHAH